MDGITNTIHFCQVKAKGSAQKKYMGYVETDGYKETVFEFKPSTNQKQIVDWIGDVLGDFSDNKGESKKVWEGFKKDFTEGNLETLEVQNGGQVESGKQIYKKLTEYIMECSTGMDNGIELQMGVHENEGVVFIASSLLATVLQEITGESNVDSTRKKLKNFLELNNLYRGNTGRLDCVINNPKGKKKCYRAWRFVPYKERQPETQPGPLRGNGIDGKTTQKRKGA